MSLDFNSLQTTLLDGKVHRREAFTCGEPTLEDYLKRQASQDSRRNAAKVYVLVTQDAPEDIIGYFTLSNLAVRLDNLLPSERKGFAPYPEIPALLIGRLAVSTSHQGQGRGGELLRRALKKCLEASEVSAAALAVVDALHHEAAGFYLRYGFQPFDDRPEYPKRLHIALDHVRKSL